MAFEKRLAELQPRALTADGSSQGQLQIDDAFLLKVKQPVYVKSNTQPPLKVEVKRVLDPTTFLVGPIGGSIDARIDVSAYLVADGATVYSTDRRDLNRPDIETDDFLRAVYDEEPTVALRTVMVDRGGRYIGSDPNYPFYIRLTDGSVNIGTVNAEIEVQLSHKANTPDPGDVPDSTRIGDGVEEWQMNPGGEGLVHDQDTHDRLDILNTTLQTESDQTQALLQSEFDETQAKIDTLTSTVQNESDQTQALLQSEFDQTQALLQSEFDETQAKIDALTTVVQNESDQTQALLQSEFDQTQTILQSEFDQTQVKLDTLTTVVQNESDQTQALLQSEFDETQALLQTEFDQTQTAIQNLQTEVDRGQYTMNEAFDKAAAIAGQLDDVGTTAATENNIAPARITPQRALHTNLRDQAGVEAGTQTNPLKTLQASVVSTGNSTMANLGIGGVFTGVGEDVLNYGNIVIGIFANVAGSFTVQWSPDNVTWVNDGDVYNVAAGTMKKTSYGPVARYFRVVYTNGAVAQSSFFIQTVYKAGHTKPSSHKITESISDSSDAELVKSVTTNTDPDGAYQNSRAQGQHSGNSSLTPLTGSATFTGLWFNWEKSHVKAVIDLATDAAGTLFVDFSQAATPTDGDDSSITESVSFSYNPTTTPLLRRHIPVQSRWVRVRYQNGASPQTTFNLDTSFTVSDPGLVLTPLETLPTNRNLAGIVRNIPALKSSDGSSLIEVPVSTAGNPKQSLAEIHDDILIKPLSSASASQTTVGTAPTQIDSPPLANRRVANVYNEGPLRIALGHTPGMTFNTGSIRVPPGSSRTLMVDSTVPLYAACENLGGIQTTSNRSPASASGTATNPNNVVASDNVYANITANGQTITATGFTAGTTNAIASIRLGLEANRPSGLTNTAAFQDSRTGSADNQNTVATTVSVIGVAGHLYLAAISRRNSAANTVTAVTGLGLTWTLLTTQPSDDGLRNIDIWYAIGTPTGSGTVTATFSAAVIHSHISVTRYSNVNPTTPIVEFQVGNANNSAATTPALAGVNKGIAYMAVAGANRTMTAGSGYTLTSSELTNDGGNSDSLSVEYKALTVTGAETPTGTLSGNAHWAAISISINPSNVPDPVVTFGYTLSAVPGATSSNVTISSSSDAVTYLNITPDRAWVFGDIPNINITLVGQSIAAAQANIDQVFIELTDTTGNTSRVSLWQGGKAVT